MLTADFGDGLFTLFGLLQNGDDLLVCLEALLRIGKLVLLHSSILPFGSTLTMLMVQFSGERSHPLRLMMKAEGYADKIVAVLHDTLEDTLLTAECLEDEGFPAEIINAIEAITKREGEDYETFIERIALNSLAVRVKLFDLYDNIDVTRLPELGDRELERAAKYHRAIKRLKQTFTSEPSAT